MPRASSGWERLEADRTAAQLVSSLLQTKSLGFENLYVVSPVRCLAVRLPGISRYQEVMIRFMICNSGEACAEPSLIPSTLGRVVRVLHCRVLSSK